jgi:hypothetical protein
VSQYNIWDEYLTQTSGLTACFLRPALNSEPRYARLQAMYEQNVSDAERILYGSERDLEALFPNPQPAELKRVRHYYHPPAMGKCFPEDPRIEYISAAVAQRGDDFALIAGTRVRVDAAHDGGYFFRHVTIDEEPTRDVVRYVDRYPGFVLDGRAVRLEASSRCTPYGVSRTCRFGEIGRYRKTPSWFAGGEPRQVTCRVRARGADCRADARVETTKVGGACDTQMQPFAGVR